MRFSGCSIPVCIFDSLILANELNRSCIQMAGGVVSSASSLLLMASKLSVRFMSSRIRYTEAFLHNSRKSEPENPFVSFDKRLRSTSSSMHSVLRTSRRILPRCSSVGIPMRNWAGIRRRIALSRSCGRFVAPVELNQISD